VTVCPVGNCATRPSTFLLAGHETTATLLLSWTFTLLSRHPSVRDTIQAELDQVLGGRTATAGDVGELPVTGQPPNPNHAQNAADHPVRSVTAR
jgi:cytochrome P450